MTGRIGAYGVNDREREFALGEIFACGTLRQRLGRGRMEVLVIVVDLEEKADCVD